MQRFQQTCDRFDRLYYAEDFTIGGADHWANHPSAKTPARRMSRSTRLRPMSISRAPCRPCRRSRTSSRPRTVTQPARWPRASSASTRRGSRKTTST
jgi:hypothetical protein